MRKPDEIMAEYLLKGGKMLSKTCQDCGSPLFEYKERTYCVVCDEQNSENQVKGSVPAPQENTSNIQKITKRGENSCNELKGTLDDEFALTIATLLRQAREESDMGRVSKILKAVKIAAQAYATLSH